MTIIRSAWNHTVLVRKDDDDGIERGTRYEGN